MLCHHTISLPLLIIAGIVKTCALAGHKSSSVDAILRKVTPHVPVPAPAVKPSQQMQQALVNLNLAATKLLSRLLPMQDAEDEDEEGWRARLLDYYTGIMQAGQLLPSRSVKARCLLSIHAIISSQFLPISNNKPLSIGSAMLCSAVWWPLRLGQAIVVHVKSLQVLPFRLCHLGSVMKVS